MLCKDSVFKCKSINFHDHKTIKCFKKGAVSNIVLKQRHFFDPENFLEKLLILETLQYDITVQGSALCSKNILLEPNALYM